MSEAIRQGYRAVRIGAQALKLLAERDATIATLTAKLAEARAMVGAVIERAARALDERGQREQREYGLGRESQNFYRARDLIRALDLDATAALSRIKREAEDAGIKIGLRAGSKVARGEAWPTNDEEAEWCAVTSGSILALTTDEARKLGGEE